MADGKFPNNDDYVSVNRRAPRNKLKRNQKDPATIEFERARDKWKAETIEEMNKIEAASFSKYQVDRGDIDYVDSYGGAESVAYDFLRVAERAKGLHPFGIDFEGDFDTMQLYTEERDKDISGGLPT